MAIMTMPNSLTAPNSSASTAAAAATPTVINPFQVQPPPPSTSSHDSTTRRSVSFGLLGGFICLKLVSPEIAEAAARRPPPSPTTEEKKDPNISGVQAKVLASKKRKEAMKQYVAKLRDQSQNP